MSNIKKSNKSKLFKGAVVGAAGLMCLGFAPVTAFQAWADYLGDNNTIGSEAIIISSVEGEDSSSVNKGNKYYIPNAYFGTKSKIQLGKDNYDTVVAHDPTIADRYFTGDVAAIGLTTDAGSQVVAAVLSEHPEYEYWMCYGLIDDISMGAAIAFDVAGLTDTCATVTFGGTGLQLQWDAGIQDSWVAACYLPQTIYAEPIIGALYAFMSGQATPETIWPEWVPNNEIVPYAMRSLPAFWIEYENYQHMIRWSDIYAGSDFYSEYPDEVNGKPITRDDFSVSVPIPEGYAGYEG